MINNADYDAMESFLIDFIKKNTSSNQDIYLYATTPPGKLFRPLLALQVARDLKNSIDQNTYFLAAALECHHAYSLVHDDLPCMDDDELRRGKASTHKQYNEWKAVLCGDGLLNLSYRALSFINSNNSQKLLKLFSWGTGPKGLIRGQELDLEENSSSFEDILRIHELKTSRLIQLALAGSYLLNTNEYQYKTFKTYLKLGSYIGIYFQLMDDLLELCEEEINQRELTINPFFQYKDESIQKLKFLDTRIMQLFDRLKLSHTLEYFQLYSSKMKKTVEDRRPNIQKHLNLDQFNL
jgi:geranylgeranyl pyrophosphate synthase